MHFLGIAEPRNIKILLVEFTKKNTLFYSRLTVSNVSNKALNHMACPAAEFLKEACRFNADYKQRTNFKRFMNRVRKTFQVESSDSSSNPLSSSKWYTEHSAVKSSDPRNHQLMVMTGDSFEVAEQFAQSIIPSNTVRGTMSDGGIKNAFNYLREIGFFGENAPSIPHDEFPSAHDRRMMALGAAMFSHKLSKALPTWYCCQPSPRSAGGGLWG